MVLKAEFNACGRWTTGNWTTVAQRAGVVRRSLCCRTSDQADVRLSRRRCLTGCITQLIGMVVGHPGRLVYSARDEITAATEFAQSARDLRRQCRTRRRQGWQ